MSALTFTWDGEAMQIAPFHRKLADKAFVIGQRYVMAEVENRSDVSHRHEFAWLREAWKSLPEGLAPDYPTAEHLRKRALIEAGYFNEEIIDAGSNAAALRVRAYVKAHDDFALSFVRGSFVIVRTAKSQSRRAMDRKTFQASKTAIMEIIANLLGVASESIPRREAA